VVRQPQGPCPGATACVTPVSTGEGRNPFLIIQTARLTSQANIEAAATTPMVDRPSREPLQVPGEHVVPVPF